MADIGRPERIIEVAPVEVPNWEPIPADPTEDPYEPVPDTEPDRELVPA